MRKILTLVWIILIFASQPSFSKTLHLPVVTNKSSTTISEGASIEFYAMTDAQENDVKIEKDTVIRAEIKKIIKPKKPKRDGYIKLSKISCCSSSGSDKAFVLNDSEYRLQLKNYNPTDYGKLAASAGLFVVGRIVSIPGLGQAFALLDGLANPIDGKNRVQSSAIRVYESVADPIKTAVSYTQKGEEIHIEENIVLDLSIKNLDRDNTPEAQEKNQGLDSDAPSDLVD